MHTTAKLLLYLDPDALYTSFIVHMQNTKASKNIHSHTSD